MPRGAVRADLTMPRLRQILPIAALALLSFLTLGFAWHSASLGLRSLFDDASALQRLYSALHPVANSTISAHMISGALVTVLAPLQVIPAIRIHWPRLHRLSGYLIVTLAAVTALAGLVYLAQRGSVGGAPMTAGFGLYGALMLLTALQTVRLARGRQFAAHRRWALRLFVLAIGSWLYRVHYGLWYAATGGLASTSAFTGLFDQIQNVAFYLPYLLLLELYLRARPDPPKPAARHSQG